MCNMCNVGLMYTGKLIKGSKKKRTEQTTGLKTIDEVIAAYTDSPLLGKDSYIYCNIGNVHTTFI